MCCFSQVSYYAWIHDKCIVWCACFRLSSFCPSTEGWPGWVNLSTNWAKHKALLHLSAPMCYQLTNVGTCHMVLWLTVVDTKFLCVQIRPCTSTLSKLFRQRTSRLMGRLSSLDVILYGLSCFSAYCTTENSGVFSIIPMYTSCLHAGSNSLLHHSLQFVTLGVR